MFHPLISLNVSVVFVALLVLGQVWQESRVRGVLLVMGG